MTTDISVGVRWDPINQQNEVIEDYEFDYDGGNSSSRLFERSRIKALAGTMRKLATLISAHVDFFFAELRVSSGSKADTLELPHPRLASTRDTIFFYTRISLFYRSCRKLLAAFMQRLNQGKHCDISPSVRLRKP